MSHVCSSGSIFPALERVYTLTATDLIPTPGPENEQFYQITEREVSYEEMLLQTRSALCNRCNHAHCQTACAPAAASNRNTRTHGGDGRSSSRRRCARHPTRRCDGLSRSGPRQDNRLSPTAGRSCRTRTVCLD